MNIYSIKLALTAFFGFAPIMAVCLDAWAIPIVIVSWTISALLLRDIMKQLKKEERRAAGQAAHRSRGRVEKTQPYYNR